MAQVQFKKILSYFICFVLATAIEIVLLVPPIAANIGFNQYESN